MRRLLSLAVAATLGAATQARAQQVKQFKDWLVSCDNLRACAAFGFEGRDTPNGSYVRIARGGDAHARPAVTFHVDLADEVKTPRLRLALGGQPHGGVPAGPLLAPKGESILDETMVADFVSALHTAPSLAFTVLNGSKPVGGSEVSLAGAWAALRFMDAQQMRAGNVSALVAKGPAPSSNAPAVPPLPVITAQPISHVAAPLPPPPAGVRPKADCLSGPGPETGLLVFQLSPDLTLWAACENWGAYNADYRLFIAGQGRVTPWTMSGFDIPGQPRRPNTRGLLTWPGLSEDKSTITSITKDEGLGDCGIASEWVWDGQALQLLGLRAMPLCRGVASGDWPVVFTARKQ